MKIEITYRDSLQNYIDPFGCPLATALKRYIDPRYEIRVGPEYFFINNDSFPIGQKLHDKLVKDKASGVWDIIDIPTKYLRPEPVVVVYPFMDKVLDRIHLFFKD